MSLNLNEEELDDNVLKTRWGRGYGTVSSRLRNKVWFVTL